MAQEHVRVERHGVVDVVTVDRPPVNALNSALIEVIQATFEGISRDPGVRAVVLTGSRRAFSVGADVLELGSLPAGPPLRSAIDRGQRLCNLIADFSRPVIAAIEGFCFGGGLELALACHLRVAGKGAQLGLPEIKLGFVPGFGGTQRLPRIIAPAVALEMMLTGEPVSGSLAHGLGLVNRVVDDGEALPAALDLAATIGSRSASAAAAILRLTRMDLADGLAREATAVVDAIGSPDGREGAAAFREKRAPRFGPPAGT